MIQTEREAQKLQKSLKSRARKHWWSIHVVASQSRMHEVLLFLCTKAVSYRNVRVLCIALMQSQQYGVHFIDNKREMAWWD